MAKKVKYYNPYPFPIRVINDLGKEQVFAPQGHGKVLKNRYTQSKLELPSWKKGAEKVYKTDLDFDLDKMLKSDLIDLAWTLLIADKVKLEEMTKREMVKAIEDKVGLEKSSDEEDAIPKDVQEAIDAGVIDATEDVVEDDEVSEEKEPEKKNEELEIDETNDDGDYKGIVDSETHGD